MPDRRLIEQIASAIIARENCAKNGNQEWFERYSERLRTIEREYLPAGSGFDAGTRIDLDKSCAERIVLETSFHHLNSDGFYVGWTEHTVTVTPSFLGGFNLRISGRDRNGIKEYITDTFYHALSSVSPDATLAGEANGGTTREGQK